MREDIIAGSRVRLTGGADRSGGGDGPLVVLLHGFGAPGDDLVPLSRQLDVPHAVRFAFPEAPIDLGAALGSGYGGGRAWWMIDPAWLSPTTQEKRSDRSRLIPPGLVEARRSIASVLEGLGASPERTVLGGFSQGAMLTMDIATRAERPFAGLALMSGATIALDDWKAGLERLRDVPVLTPSWPFPRALSFAIYCVRRAQTSDGSSSPAAIRSPGARWTVSGS